METNTQETPEQPADAGCVRRLIGRLVFAGDLEINGEKITGLALESTREELMRCESIPMYRECFVATIDHPDSLTYSEWDRLAKWFADPYRRPANFSFTAGACRDAATAFEHAQFLANATVMARAEQPTNTESE